MNENNREIRELIGSLSKDVGNGNDDATKQCSEWLNGEK